MKRSDKLCFKIDTKKDNYLRLKAPPIEQVAVTQENALTIQTLKHSQSENLKKILELKAQIQHMREKD